jgi:hypothetical protein
VLTREAVGDELEHLASDILDETERLDHLQRGRQIGWCSDDLEYRSLRDRLYDVGRRLLGQLPTAQDLDPQQRGELYRDAHGLLTTMTSLLEAIGVDVTIHLRVPDVENIRRDDPRRRDFMGFLSRTVPKQTQYGTHSGWRQVFERREEKLKARLPVNIDPDDPVANTTASWVVTGPGAEEFVNEAAATLNDLEEREAVQDGTEETIAMDIPVAGGTSFAANKRVVEDILRMKGFLLESDETRQITRLLMGVLGHDPWKASPYAIAQALLSLGKSNGTELGTYDVRYALSTLPADRLFPELAPSAQKMVKVLLEADQPLTPGEIRDHADISESSYDRYIDVLETVGVLCHTEGQWQAVIEPWWAPESSREQPDSDTTPESARPWADDMLFEMALALEGDQHLADVWTRSATYEEIADAVPALRPWIPWVVALIDDPLPTDSDEEIQRAKLGSPPTPENPQTSLSEGFA